MIIKPTSLTVAQLLGSANERYLIPAYQRRYSWREKQLWELIDDISLIEGSDTHLLGSIVCLTGYHSAGINTLELVDGQQRLTTISILLECIRERMISAGESEPAKEVERMLQAKALGAAPVRKIALDSIDAAEFDKHAQNKSPANPENVNLSLAFSLFREWVAGKQLPDLGSFLYRLQNQAIVIRLDVSEAKDAFKLFETINNRGLRLSPTDILKNFILGNAARFGEAPLSLAREHWAELIHALDGVNIDVFFRQFLMARMKKRVRASDVISYFKKLFMTTVIEAAKLPDRHWYADESDATDEDDDGVDGSADTSIEITANEEGVSFEAFLSDLIRCATVYGQIALANTGLPKIDRRLRHLRMIKSLQTYSFLMHLRVGGCDDKTFERILEMTEAFMLRRHICRERSNENESAFARLCDLDCHDPLPKVVETFREYSPTDEKFQSAFAKAEFTATLIDRARYCLEQFEYYQLGEFQELEVNGTGEVHVEHIIPQAIKTKKAKNEFGDWVTYLGAGAEALHSSYVSRIGNLTLFAGTLNIVASNNPYASKKNAYRQSSMRIAKSLPEEYTEFRFAEVDARSEEFASIAVTRWPIP